MKTTFQRARRENEMLRAILKYSKPHWSRYALTKEETDSLTTKGCITPANDKPIDDPVRFKLLMNKARYRERRAGKKKGTH